MTAIAASTVGATNLGWARYARPRAKSGAHHHGDCENVICVTSGRPASVSATALTRALKPALATTSASDRNVVHQEINLSDNQGIDSIVVRDSQENVVVNVDVPEA